MRAFDSTGSFLWRAGREGSGQQRHRRPRVAHRGHHDDNQYYQMYKGRICEPVLEAMGLPHWVVDGPEGIGVIGDAARQAWLNRMPVVVLLRRRALVGPK